MSASTHPANQATTPPFFTPAMLRCRWSCSAMKIRRWMRNGKLPYHVFGRHIRIAWADIQRIEAAARVDLSEASTKAAN